VLELREGVSRSADFPAATVGEDGARTCALYRDNVLERVLHPRRTGTVAVPVLIVEATGDRFVTRHTLDAAGAFVGDLTRRQLDAGHWAPRTHPELVARWITRHVDRAERGAPAVRPRPERTKERPLYGRVALITGAGSGIGRATALRFARAGADLILVDRDLDSARATAGRLLDEPVSTEAHRCDVSDRMAVDALAAELGAVHEAIDILVNNAGIGASGGLIETEPELWGQVLDVNLNGVAHGCRAFGRQMVERGEGGHIINVASMAAFVPSKQMAAYSTAKAGVLMLSECLRAELGGAGIGVSAICPGVIQTPITTTARFGGRTEAEQQRLRETATRMFALRGYPPERVADAILGAVLRNRAVVPVAPEAHAMRLLARLSPGLVRRLARMDLMPA
jgi:NAD(P)-dependent dehydrogenase (short-subunit alcohol dehydrogenase family)